MTLTIRDCKSALSEGFFFKLQHHNHTKFEEIWSRSLEHCQTSWFSANFIVQYYLPLNAISKNKLDICETMLVSVTSIHSFFLIRLVVLKTAQSNRLILVIKSTKQKRKKKKVNVTLFIKSTNKQKNSHQSNRMTLAHKVNK